MSEESVWYYLEVGRRIGPVTGAILRQRLSSGLMRPDDLVWCAGMTTWMPIASLGEFAADAMTAAPPVFRQHVHFVDASAIEDAGFGRRLLAFLIDMVVLGCGGCFLGIGVVILSSVMLGHEISDESTPVEDAMINVFGLLLSWLYYALMESSTLRATVGKMALGIVVVDEKGHQIGFGRATGRFFGKILSGLILGFGYLMILFSPMKQGLHDTIAGCRVIRRAQF